MLEAAFNCLVVSTFAMAFNLPVGRALLAATFVLYCLSCYRRREVPEIRGLVWYSAVFFAIAILSTIQGISPGDTWIKLRKLPWYLVGIFTYSCLVNSPWRLGVVLNSFAAGMGVLAIFTLITKPLAALKNTNEGITFVHAL